MIYLTNTLLSYCYYHLLIDYAHGLSLPPDVSLMGQGFFHWNFLYAITADAHTVCDLREPHTLWLP